MSHTPTDEQATQTLTEEAIFTYHLGLQFLVKLDVVLSRKEVEALRQRYIREAARYPGEEISVGLRCLATACQSFLLEEQV